MKESKFCSVLVIALVLAGVCLKNVEAFVCTEQLPFLSKPVYIEAQLVLDQSRQINPAYVRTITRIANFLGANVSEKQVEQVLQEKMDVKLVVRLANIALMASRGSIDHDINKPVPVLIEFKDNKSKEDIVRGLARQQQYEMKNGLGGLRLGKEINASTIAAESIGILGIADLIVLLTRQDSAPYVVKVTLDKKND